MHLKEQDNFLLGVQHALTLPVRTRCAELAVLLDRATTAELHAFFPVLVDNVFGPQGASCWGLRTTTDESSADDRAQLQYFLSPCGPMFKFIYALLKDANVKYEFPLTYLPVKIRRFLEKSHGHPFYSELIRINEQNRQNSSLLLNPFDYYIFHFAYHLINPWQQRPLTCSTTNSWDTVYYNLCCDYICHFLPTEPGCPVLPVIYYNGKNPQRSMESGFLERKRSNTGLITPKFLDKTPEDAFKKNIDVHHPRNEIWRSETVLTVFIDMWLYGTETDDVDGQFRTPQTFQKLYRHAELPSAEYMRVLRAFVKRLHSFSACSRADDTPMAELRKVSVPMAQSKFYSFLRNLIHRWPLDGSFRLVLELWLTYLQPWRYPPGDLARTAHVDGTVTTFHAGREYLPFIAENLLTYIVIFQQLLPRFGRVDIVSPKMAQMLYRLTKVFAQPDLPQLLREVEQCVENNPSPTRKYDDPHRTLLPPLSPTANWSTNTASLASIRSSTTTMGPSSGLLHVERRWSALVRQKMFELEGPNFCYRPLFGDPPAPEVFDMLLQIKRSLVEATELVRAKREEERRLYSGFWGHIKYYFSDPVTNDEFTLKEREKVPMYLQTSLASLMDMFGISEEAVSKRQTEALQPQTSSAFDVSNDMKFLTPERVRARLKQITYEGDPDLLPIQSDENAFLVRTLYQLSKKINETYGPQLYRLYHSPTYLGRLSREFLCPPRTVHRFDKSLPGSPRVAETLPPRLSLRRLAGHRLLAYVLVGAVAASALGYRAEAYVATLLVAVVAYKAARAARRPGHGYPTEGFGNISFNDSF